MYLESSDLFYIPPTVPWHYHLRPLVVLISLFLVFTNFHLLPDVCKQPNFSGTLYNFYTSCGTASAGCLWAVSVSCICVLCVCACGLTFELYPRRLLSWHSPHNRRAPYSPCSWPCRKCNGRVPGRTKCINLMARTNYQSSREMDPCTLTLLRINKN